VISFRYHLVSIVAVFLALALGIVVGTTALNGPITKDLRRQVSAAKTQRDTYAQQVNALHGQLNDAGQFAATYGSQLVTGTLAGKTVLLVDLPGVTSGMQDGVQTLLAAAGAKIGGRVSVTPQYLDPRRGGGITSLATGPAHPVGLTLPTTSNAADLGGALLAYVLLGKGQQTDLSQVLGGFAELHMITVAGSAGVTPSTAVLVLAPGRQPARSYPSSAELALVNALAHAGGHVVVAGDPAAATSGGLVATVRNASGSRTMVATVDDADNPLGQVSAVLALSAAVKGQIGQYGTKRGADALYPPPAG
jgi:hypothetical protein